MRRRKKMQCVFARWDLSMTPALKRTIAHVREAIAGGDPASIFAAVYDLETAAMQSPQAVREIAQQIIQWLATSEFRKAAGVWRVMFALRHDLDELPETDRNALFLAMIDAFPYFEDLMSCFIVSELAELFPFDWVINELDAKVGHL